MRQRMVRLLHLRVELKRLSAVLAKAPDDVEALKKKSDMTDMVLDLMIEEMADMSRDITSAAANSRRFY